MYSHKSLSLRLNSILILSFFLSILSLFISRSMTSILLFFPLLGVFCWLNRRSFNKAGFALLQLIISLTVTIGLIGVAVSGINLVSTFFLKIGKETTLTGRTEIWEIASIISSKYPILGIGFGAFWTSPIFAYFRLLTQDAGAVTSVSFHNFLIEIFVGTGVLGVFSILLVLFTGFRLAFQFYGRNNNSISSFCITIFLAIFFCSLFGPSFYRGHEFFISIFVMYISSVRESLFSR
nr:O-antigen ligase family protein [Donghicola mangrovi]